MMHFQSAHLSDRQVSEFSEGDCVPSERSGIEAHLIDCAQCRASVSATRAVLAIARKLPTPGPDAAVLARIVARRKEGARVLLPTESAVLFMPRSLGSHRIWSMAAAAVIVLGVSLVLLPGSAPRDLAAGDLDGSLMINPTVAARGDSVHLAYRAGSIRSGDRVLRVRARYYAAGDHEPEWSSTYVNAATLTRDGDGVFRGALTLPDSIVYATLVVEDTLGRFVDSRGGRLWELLTRNTAESPSFSSLRQRVLGRENRDPGSTLAASRELTEAFPRNPEGWALRVWYELDAVGPTLADSVRHAFNARLVTLDAYWRKQPTVSDKDLGHLADVARQLSADSLRVYWEKRLKEAARAHRGPAREWIRLDEIAELKDGHVALAALDSFWRDTVNSEDGRRSALVRSVTILGASRDTAAISLWCQRLARYADPNWRAWPAYKLAHTPGLEARGAELTRGMLHIYATDSDDAHRPLGMSAEEHRASVRRIRGGLLHTLGDALAATGEIRQAQDTLERSVRDRWNAAAYRTLAGVYATLGNPAGQATALAHVAADPGSSPDSVRAARGRLSGHAELLAQWSQLVAAARIDLQRSVLADAIRRPLRGTVRLVGTNGRERTLAQITDGKPAAVAFWSRWCSGSRQFLPALTSSAARLRAVGIPLIAITAEPPTPELVKWMSDNSVKLDMYYDARGEARSAFAARGTPDQFVVDERGVIRFVGGEPADLAPRVQAIRTTR